MTDSTVLLWISILILILAAAWVGYRWWKGRQPSKK